MRRPRALLFTASLGLAWSAYAPLPAALAEGPRSLGSDLFAIQEGRILAVAQGTTVTPLDLGPRVRPERLVETRDGWLLTATREDGDDPSGVFLWERDATGSLREIPTPAVGPDSALRDPIPLLGGDGDLDGLVWLEGPDPGSLSIRHAVWTGAAWHDPIAVVPPGPGSQLALDAAPLPDGSYLMVWARYDGGDDEVVWSRLGREGATEPLRVLGDNTVPDITPALTATDDGVLLAWSRYDGNDYRLHLARFTSGRWDLVAILADRGGVFPSWQRTASGELFLVYRNGAEARWSVARVDPGGRMLAVAAVEGPSEDRPRIEAPAGEPSAVFSSGRAVGLRWMPVPRLP